MSHKYDNMVITFNPELPCRASQCDNFTSLGLLDITDPKEYSLYPVCEWHGFCYSVPQEQEYASIVRYVLADHDGHGQAEVLTTCPLEEVPGGYKPEGDARFDDQAWKVRYTDEQGMSHPLYVVWLVDYQLFETFAE